MIGRALKKFDIQGVSSNPRGIQEGLGCIARPTVLLHVLTSTAPRTDLDLRNVRPIKRGDKAPRKFDARFFRTGRLQRREGVLCGARKWVGVRRFAACGRELVGERREVGDDARAEGTEEGEELVANAGAEEARVVVRRIARERNGVPGDVLFDRLARRAEKWANARAIVGSRGEGGEPVRPGTTEKAQEHGLRAVVGVVRCRNVFCADQSRGGVERVVPRCAGARLQVPSVGERELRARERYAERLREFFRAVELERRARAQAMIDAVREEDVTDARTKAREHVKQRHGVGPSAHRNEHTIAR